MEVTQLTVRLDDGKEVSIEKMGNSIFKVGDADSLANLTEYEQDKIDIVANFVFNSKF